MMCWVFINNLRTMHSQEIALMPQMHQNNTILNVWACSGFFFCVCLCFIHAIQINQCLLSARWSVQVHEFRTITTLTHTHTPPIMLNYCCGRAKDWIPKWTFQLKIVSRMMITGVTHFGRMAKFNKLPAIWMTLFFRRLYGAVTITAGISQRRISFGFYGAVRGFCHLRYI